jgi:hypothetical protein
MEKITENHDNSEQVVDLVEPPKKRKYTVKTRAKKYETNPYMQGSEPIVSTRTKRITNNQGNYMVKSDSGEVVASIAGFWQAEEVDSTKFLKLYVNGVKAFSGLSTKGTKVFELMYYEMQKEIGKDKIYLNFNAIDPHIKIAKTTFYDGISELVEKKFLAPTTFPHWFWVNPDYIWNGDRLSFVKTYIRKEEKKIPARDTKTGDLFENENKTDKL